MNEQDLAITQQLMEVCRELLENAHAVKGQAFVNVAITLFDLNQVAAVLGRLAGAHQDPVARVMACQAVMLLGRVGAHVTRELSPADTKEAADLANQMADRQHALSLQLTGEN